MGFLYKFLLYTMQTHPVHPQYNHVFYLRQPATLLRLPHRHTHPLQTILLMMQSHEFGISHQYVQTANRPYEPSKPFLPLVYGSSLC